eukprot:GDKJ01003010.1.p1 GENE.GDKJ01003010.1~~GDKJ01003010.1.p1  ORF type:complete len:844 (+),score=144.81 GDKJ01003010.1:162-2534(+)
MIQQASSDLMKLFSLDSALDEDFVCEGDLRYLVMTDSSKWEWKMLKTSKALARIATFIISKNISLRDRFILHIRSVVASVDLHLQLRWISRSSSTQDFITLFQTECPLEFIQMLLQRRFYFSDFSFFKILLDFGISSFFNQRRKNSSIRGRTLPKNPSLSIQTCISRLLRPSSTPFFSNDTDSEAHKLPLNLSFLQLERFSSFLKDYCYTPVNEIEYEVRLFDNVSFASGDDFQGESSHALNLSEMFKFEDLDLVSIVSKCSTLRLPPSFFSPYPYHFDEVGTAFIFSILLINSNLIDVKSLFKKCVINGHPFLFQTLIEDSYVPIPPQNHIVVLKTTFDENSFVAHSLRRLLSESADCRLAVELGVLLPFEQILLYNRCFLEKESSPGSEEDALSSEFSLSLDPLLRLAGEKPIPGRLLIVSPSEFKSISSLSRFMFADATQNFILHSFRTITLTHSTDGEEGFVLEGVAQRNVAEELSASPSSALRQEASSRSSPLMVDSRFVGGRKWNHLYFKVFGSCIADSAKYFNPDCFTVSAEGRQKFNVGPYWRLLESLPIPEQGSFNPTYWRWWFKNNPFSAYSCESVFVDWVLAADCFSQFDERSCRCAEVVALVRTLLNPMKTMQSEKVGKEKSRIEEILVRFGFRSLFSFLENEQNTECCLERQEKMKIVLINNQESANFEIADIKRHFRTLKREQNEFVHSSVDHCRILFEHEKINHFEQFIDWRITSEVENYFKNQLENFDESTHNTFKERDEGFFLSYDFFYIRNMHAVLLLCIWLLNMKTCYQYL